MNTAKIKSTLLKSLQDAGKLLKTQIANHHVVEKKSALSIVTETDKKAEQIIIRHIQKNFPDHAILTEESPPQGRSSSRWIIDPLDGTSNFAHTFPVCCVSIGYEEAGEMVMGGVYDPFRDELFFAERGKGAVMNNKKIHVSRTPWLSDALLATGFAYDRRERMDDYLAMFRSFLMKVLDLRRAGAAAIDLCYVACGRFDGYWECGLHSWDKAAGMLIVQEAGGKVSNFKNKPLTLDDYQNVASNGFLHQEMMKVLKPFENLEKR